MGLNRWRTIAVIVSLAAVPLAAGAAPAAASPAATHPGQHRVSAAAAAEKRRAEALAAEVKALRAWAAAVAALRADVIAHERMARGPEPVSAASVPPGSTGAAGRPARAGAGPVSAAALAIAGLALFVMGALAAAGTTLLLRRRRTSYSPGPAMTAGGAPEWLTAPVLTDAQDTRSPLGAQDPPSPLAAAPSPELLIGILGTFTINGAPAALKPAQGQLLLSLALNGDEGMSNAMMCDLFGPDPDHPKPGDSLRQLIARTRRQLGRSGDGREWIEHHGGGWYALHPDTRFDWAEFEEMTERGSRESDRALLSGALALVRGEPFRDCDWWWLDQAFLQTVRARIAETALTLAELELAAGDARASARAARTGLSIDPADERLWRALMRAEHDAGRPAAVQDAWNTCLAELADIALDGQPHPDTAALHRELTACPAAEGVPAHRERTVA
jgi:DNA-binding SARP family transcriptional activator